MHKNGIVKRMAVSWILCAALTSFSCGGGGGSDGGAEVTSDAGSSGSSSSSGDTTFPGFTPAAPGTSMTVNQDNTIRATSLAGFGHVVGSLSGFASFSASNVSADTMIAKNEPSILRRILLAIREAAPSGKFQVTASNNATRQCANGGDIEVSMSWDDPTPSNPCNLANAHGRMIYHNCSQSLDALAYGTIDFEFQGLLCTPTAMSFDLTEFYERNGAETLQTRALDIEITQLEYSGQSVVQAITLMNGQAVGAVDGRIFAAAFDGLTEVFEQISAVQLSVAFSGNITGPCLDGWASLSTSIPILLDDSQDCPLAGHVVVSGNGDPMDAIFNADGSTAVGETTFDSCDDAQASCPLL